MTGLDPQTRRWLEFEQTVNERLYPEVDNAPSDLTGRTVNPRWRPERRNEWPQRVIWLPANLTRTYGNVEDNLRAAFSCRSPPGKSALLIHPQPPAAHRRLAEEYGEATLSKVLATATASYRSLLTVHPDHSPVILKLSVGAVVGGLRRGVKEKPLASAVVISSILDTIPDRIRRGLNVDWFSEPCGVVDVKSRKGWLLRTFPRHTPQRRRSTLVPMFSLISKHPERHVPLLVEMILNSDQRAETFILEKLLKPYVSALAYLLFVQGIAIEGHPQNVLFEVDDSQSLTGRVVIRDLSDASVNIALRVARNKPLPVFPSGFLPGTAPFSQATAAADHQCSPSQPAVLRARDVVECFGLKTFVWCLNTSVARFFPRFNSGKVEKAYLGLWQEAAVEHFNLRPPLREPGGISTDGTMAHLFRIIDWQSLGATNNANLPGKVESLRLKGRLRRRSGRVYQRLECSWGDLYLDENLPAFFRPAF